MRPVKRGARPRARWSDYNQARPHLEKRLGDYCSYCEMPNATDVEHKLPKEEHPGRKLSWGNFLLSCRSCNSIKNNQQDPGKPTRPRAALALYLWPDTDNTARAFVYDRHKNNVTVAPGLSADLTKAALETIRMTGIDCRPRKTSRLTKKDKRWQKREGAWKIAESMQQTILANDTPELRTAIGALAAATGFWSVWRVVFAGDSGMLQIIDAAFLGTPHDCFDPTTRQPVARPRGRL